MPVHNLAEKPPPTSYVNHVAFCFFSLLQKKNTIKLQQPEINAIWSPSTPSKLKVSQEQQSELNLTFPWTMFGLWVKLMRLAPRLRLVHHVWLANWSSLTWISQRIGHQSTLLLTAVDRKSFVLGLWRFLKELAFVCYFRGQSFDCVFLYAEGVRRSQSVFLKAAVPARPRPAPAVWKHREALVWTKSAFERRLVKIKGSMSNTECLRKNNPH